MCSVEVSSEATPHKETIMWTAAEVSPPSRPGGVTGLAAAMVALALVAVGCGSSSSSTPTAASVVAAGASGTGEVPGSEEFGLTMEELALRVEQVEAAIGTCMSKAGFQYIPVDFDTIRAGQAADKTAPGVSDEVFLAQFGFGITTRPGEPNSMIAVAQGQNRAIVDALAPADRVAYTRTLLGENTDAAFVVGLEDEDFSETGGCTRAAVDQYFGTDEVSGSYVNPGDVLIDNDARMVTAIALWSQCLAEAGYDFDQPDDLTDDLHDRYDAIVGDQDPTALSGSSLDSLAELQGFERAVASLAEDCEDEFIVPVEEQIETELYGAPQN